MNHVVVAPDKFKGSLTAAQAAGHLAAGLRRSLPGLDVRQVPVADGGEGTVDAAVAAGYRRVHSGYAERNGTAVMELADTAGPHRLPGGVRDPLGASSYRTGQVLRAALNDRCSTVVLGLGGSACTDGGAGLLQAMGVRLLDRRGTDIRPGGAGLADLARADAGGLHPLVRQARIVIASDVDNPLLGPTGTAAVYGPQKGATTDQVVLLERGLTNLCAVLERDLGVAPAVAERPGAGAAGGVGYAALAVLGAIVRPGIEHLLHLVQFHAQLPGAALVVTGEGSLDAQTLHGKAPAGVAAAARAAGVPVVAVAGRCELSGLALQAAGFDTAYALTDLEPDPVRCVVNAGPLLETLAADQLARQCLQPVGGAR